MKNNKIGLGLIGLGTVGMSVLKLFFENKKNIIDKIGAQIEFIYCYDKDKRKKNFLCGKKIKFVNSAEHILNDQLVDAVVELTGSKNYAKQIILNALSKKKHVISANKAVISENWDEIITTSNKNGKVFYFEAAVGAGIPILRSLNEGLAGNNIVQITGILNGTTNYILYTMSMLNQPFDTALKTAQRYGFAESDPSMDIKGYDTAHKLSILSSIAFNSWVKTKNIFIQGIENIELQDIRFASGFGYNIKLLGRATIIKNKYNFEVRQFLVQQKNIFANTPKEENAIMLEGDYAGKIFFIGKGAGGNSAASAVISDIIYMAKGVLNNTAGKIPYIIYDPKKKLDIEDSMQQYGRFYVRFITVDRSGVLAKIADILGKYNVSIASVYQKETLTKRALGVPIVLITHNVKEQSLFNALEKIRCLDVVLKQPIYIKIFEEN